MGFFENKEVKLNEELKEFKIYTYEHKFKEEIVDTKFILRNGINMYDTITDIVRESKQSGFHAINGAKISGDGSMYFYGTAIKLKK